MPLEYGGSDKAFKHNVRAEMNAGKPQKQSLAIAYAIKRRNKAKGGEMCAEGCSMDHEHNYASGGDVKPYTVMDESGEHKRVMEEVAHLMKSQEDYHDQYAEGGDVGDMGDDDETPKAPAHYDVAKGKQMSDAFMNTLAEGGFVDEEEASGYHAMPEPYEGESEEYKITGDEDYLVKDIMDRRAKGYSEGGRVADSDGPVADFEENDFDDLVKDDHLEADYPGKEDLGDARLDDDEHDIVMRIMKSRRKKDRLPSPA